jgi:hypothetical protein
VGRLLILADGVFAIALTPLVLSVRVDVTTPASELEAALRDARPASRRPDESLDLMPGRIDAGQIQLLYAEAGLALGIPVATLERDGVIVPDSRTGGPSFVRSGVAYLHTDFGREVLAAVGQPE